MDLTSGSVTALDCPVKQQKGAAVNRAFLHFVAALAQRHTDLLVGGCRGRYRICGLIVECNLAAAVVADGFVDFCTNQRFLLRVIELAPDNDMESRLTIPQLEPDLRFAGKQSSQTPH